MLCDTHLFHVSHTLVLCVALQKILFFVSDNRHDDIFVTFWLQHNVVTVSWWPHCVCSTKTFKCVTKHRATHSFLLLSVLRHTSESVTTQLRVTEQYLSHKIHERRLLKLNIHSIPFFNFSHLYFYLIAFFLLQQDTTRK
jgi:hypothetical protein